MRARSLIILAVMMMTVAACGGDGEDGTETTAGSATETSAAAAETTTAAETTAGAETTAAAETTGATETSAATSDIETIEAGTLTVCTDAPYVPMEFEEDGEFTGFDIELMRLIATDLGLELAVNNSGFDPITTGSAFAGDLCDIAAASITITEERAEAIDFTDPYFTADQSLLTKTDSGIATIEDLAGQTFGVQSGTTGEAFAQENAPEDATIQSYDNPGDLFVALESGEIVAILQDLVVNQGRTLEDDTVAVVETYPTDEEYGFALEKDGNPALLAAVNEALAALQESGEYDALFEEWFGE
ncbi:MAG: transporter substrate-binding domain-containing protein [Acidimicrobiia bacterium]|nr:transporter substrate-binding domain-containing protein [Acidimicrobiia bacterium]